MQLYYDIINIFVLFIYCYYELLIFRQKIEPL